MPHTEGPWEAKHRHAGAAKHDDERAGLGWDIVGPPVPQIRGRFSRAADAHLVAAAPDLLAALSDLMEYREEIEADLGVWASKASVRRLLDTAQAAIAKAKGES